MIVQEPKKKCRDSKFKWNHGISVLCKIIPIMDNEEKPIITCDVISLQRQHDSMTEKQMIVQEHEKEMSW